MIRRFEWDAAPSAREFGRAHGEAYRSEIQTLGALRVYLCHKVGGISSEQEVIRLAKKHMPVLEAFDKDLAEELYGIAEGAKTTIEHIVALNHYTDLRDLGATQVKDEDGCSTIYAKTPNGPVLAQTWDMHATAIPYVMMLKAPPTLGGPAWLLALTGCVGMAGFHKRGLGIAINNLHSLDARIGVIWPALVRRCLRADSAAAAKEVIMNAQVGSGHHYLVADRERAFGIETSGQRKQVVYDSTKAESFIHTNHCLNKEINEVLTIPAASTTQARYDQLVADVKRKDILNARDAYDRLGNDEGFPYSVCTNQATPQNPHGPATCGAISIDLRMSEALCVGGFPHRVEPERFTL